MSPNNKSKARNSKQGRETSRSKRRSRRSPSRQTKGKRRPAAGKEGRSTKQGEVALLNAPKAEKAQRRRRRKRVPIGEALRRRGLDEHTIAGTYAEVVDNLKNDGEAKSGAKLLVDILKECSRHIEAAQPVGEGAVQVQLVHKVERPVRKAPIEESSPSTGE